MERTFTIDRDLAQKASRKLQSSFRESDQMERGEIPMKRYVKTEDMISDCVSADAKKKIISLRSRGNVKLQLGRVMTSCEYEKQKAEVLAYDFS